MRTAGTKLSARGVRVGGVPRKEIDQNHFGDILAVLAAWGPYQPCPPAIAEDINHNCSVDFADLLVVLAAWGSCPK